jgi:hypothetical protein
MGICVGEGLSKAEDLEGGFRGETKKDDVRVAYVSEREGKVIFVVNI